MYSCDICDFDYKTKTGYNLHYSSHHEKKIFCCNECGKAFALKSVLKRHVNDIHIKNVKHSCDKCKKEYSSKSTLTLHIKAIHGGKRFICVMCNKEFTQVGNFKRHQESVHEGIKYQCTFCDYKATTKSSLETHNQSKHEGKKFLCDICNSIFTHMSALRFHKKSVHNGETISCENCNFKTTSRSYLTAHQKAKHLAGNTIPSKHCYYLAKYRLDLYKHMYVAHDGMGNKIGKVCSICEYQTMYKSNLLRNTLNCSIQIVGKKSSNAKNVHFKQSGWKV